MSKETLEEILDELAERYIGNMPKATRQQRAMNRVEHLAYKEGWNARDAIAKQREQVMQWQPIETAPKDGTRILGYVGISYYKVQVVHFRPRLNLWANEIDKIHSYAEGEITHWMPLPAPPEGEGK